MQNIEGAWQSHPFHPQNNVNAVDGDADGDGRGLEIHTLARPDVTRRQEAYVRHVVETIGDLDNVLYEISNENHPPSTEWQYHMIRFIHELERSLPKQHPVGMTFQYRGGRNAALFESPAEWISPNPDGGYRDDPPAADGRKVILTDTDHLWGIGGNGPWVWKSFLRGLCPLFMDPYDGLVLGEGTDPQWETVRRVMGHVRRTADAIDLAACQPRPDLSGGGYCLAAAGRVYVVYVPAGQTISVDLSDAEGMLTAEWIDADQGTSTTGRPVAGGARRELAAPGSGDAVAVLRR